MKQLTNRQRKQRRRNLYKREQILNKFESEQMQQIVISIAPNGSINLAAPQGMSPITITGILELCKTMAINNMINPQAQPAIMPATADALDQINRVNGTGG